MNEVEARRYVVSHGADWDDRAEYVRWYCAGCGKWVLVDDYSGERGRCDDC